jgi:hypothetical protein
VNVAPGPPIAGKMSQPPGRNAAHCPGWPLQRQGHPKIVSKTASQKRSSGPTLDPGDLCQPSGPDGEGQARGQARNARGEPRLDLALRTNRSPWHISLGNLPSVLCCSVMNPAILGALIGAIPGTIAAGLATWSSVRTSYVTLAGDHDRWLRERRADTYVELLQFLRNAEVRRAVILIPQEVTAEIQRKIKDGFEIHTTSEMYGLAARAYAYTSDEAFTAFTAALSRDLEVWQMAQGRVKARNIEIGNELEQAVEDADKAAHNFILKARIDLQKLSTR